VVIKTQDRPRSKPTHISQPPPRMPLPMVTSRQGGGWAATLLISTLLLFMVVPEGFNYEYALSDKGIPTSGSLMSRLTWLALLASGIGIILSRLAEVRVIFKASNPYIWLFVALAFASITWSVDPSLTLRRMIRVFTIIFAALAFTLVAWHEQRFQSVIRTILTILLVGSVIFIVVDPRLSIERSTQAELVGAWHGLAVQKNVFGSLCSIATLLWLHALMTGSVGRFSSAFFLVLSVVCLVKSRSSTSLMATLFSAFLMLLMSQIPKAFKRYMPYAVGLFVGVILVYSLAVLRLVPGLDFILKPIIIITGKDLTFTGRSQIWEVINEQIARNPILGTGYGAYWAGPLESSPSYEMLQRLNFYPTQSHNGYLDVVNDLGTVGAFVLIGFMTVYLRQALKLFALHREQGTIFLVLLFQQLVGNLSEAHWFSVRSVEFVIMSIAALALSRSLLFAQQQKQLMQYAMLKQRAALGTVK
jgi:exopolysaccharide production protein ExoQ